MLAGEVTSVKQRVQTTRDGDLRVPKEDEKRLLGQGDGSVRSLGT
jgi:hypothetical protein